MAEMRVEIVARLGRTFAVDQNRAVVGVGANGGQRLIQFMGDARRDFSQRGQLAGLNQFVLRVAQFGFGLPMQGDFPTQAPVGFAKVRGLVEYPLFQQFLGVAALGHVVDRHHEAGAPPLLEFTDRQIHGKGGAVGPPTGRFEIPGAVGVGRLAKQPAYGVAVRVRRSGPSARGPMMSSEP